MDAQTATETVPVPEKIAKKRGPKKGSKRAPNGTSALKGRKLGPRVDKRVEKARAAHLAAEALVFDNRLTQFLANPKGALPALVSVELQDGIVPTVAAVTPEV